MEYVDLGQVSVDEHGQLIQLHAAGTTTVVGGDPRAVGEQPQQVIQIISREAGNTAAATAAHAAAAGIHVEEDYATGAGGYHLPTMQIQVVLVKTEYIPGYAVHMHTPRL